MLRATLKYCESRGIKDISVDLFQEILSKGKDHLAYLTNERGELELNEEAVYNLTKAYIDELAVKQALELIENIKSKRDDIDALEQLANAQSNAATSMWDLVYAQLAATGVHPRLMQSFMNQINVLKEMAEATKAGVSQGGLTGGKSAAEIAKDKAKAYEEYQNSIDKANDSLEKLNKEEKLDKLKQGIESVKLLIDQLSNTKDTIDLQLELTDEHDFSTKLNLYTEQYSLATEKGKLLREEFERLANTTPATADEANLLANRLEELGKELRSNLKDVIEYRKQVALVNLDVISKSADTAIQQLSNATKVLERDLNKLQKGSLFGDAFNISMLLPSMPKDALSKQRRENELLIAEEERYQAEIEKIKKTALTKQYAENAIARQEARQQLYQDMQDALETYQEKLAELEKTSSVTTKKVADDISGTTKDVKDNITKDVDEINSTLSEIGNVELSGNWNTLADDVKAYLESIKISVQDWNEWVQENANKLQAFILSDTSWDALTDELRQWMKDTFSITHDDWTKLVEQYPIVAMKLKELGTNSWGELRNKMITLVTDMVQECVDIVQGTVLPAPQFDESAYVSLGVRMGDTISSALMARIGEATVGSGGSAANLGGLSGSSLGSGNQTQNDLASFFGGTSTSGYGSRNPSNPKASTFHQAWDFGFSEQTPIKSATAGTVVTSDFSNGNGNYIVVRGTDGYEFYYLHMSQRKAEIGQKVSAGDILGLSGATGTVSVGAKNTLDFRIKSPSGGFIDPANYTFPKYADGGVTSGQEILAGELGRELGILPNGKVIMLGEDGASLYDLPTDTKIISNQETEEVLKYTGTGIVGKQIPKFANGTRNYTVENYKDLYTADERDAIVRQRIKDVAEAYARMSGSLNTATNAVVDFTKGLDVSSPEIFSTIEQLSAYPATYTDEFIKMYGDYATQRNQNLKYIESIKEKNPQEAARLAAEQKDKDIAKTIDMRMNLYKSSAEQLENNYNDLLGKFQEAIDKDADISVLEKYIEGLQTIEENMSELDSGFQSLVESLYSIQINAKQNYLTLLENQMGALKENFDLSGMKGNWAEQIKTLREVQDYAHASAEKLREAGYDEYGDEIQGFSQLWWQSQQRIVAINSEIYQTELDRQKVYVDGILKIIDKERKALEKRRDYYENQKSDYETAVSTVTKVIDEQIKALQDQNSELDKQLKTQQAIEDLAKAESQRTARVYVEGQGFVWQADDSAVKSAKDSLDELNRQNALEEEIEALEKYKEKWQDTVSNYQEQWDKKTTSDILGSNWEKDILEQRTNNINWFEKNYNSYCDQLNEDVTGSVAAQIVQLNNLAEEWGNSLEDISGDIVTYQEDLDALKVFEGLNYKERLGELQTFVSKSKATLAELQAAQNATMSGSSNSNSRNAESASYDPSIDYQALINTEEAKSNPDKKLLAEFEKARNEKIDDMGLSYEKTRKYYSQGGVVDYTGSAEVHGSSSKSEVVFNSTDASKLYRFIHDTPDLFKKMFGDIGNLVQRNMSNLVTNTIPLSSIIPRNVSPVPSFSIGDIIISNPVGDVNSLSKAIVNQLPMRMKQDLMRWHN